MQTIKPAGFAGGLFALKYTDAMRCRLNDISLAGGEKVRAVIPGRGRSPRARNPEK
jgi:hypothetical protein